jgi:hypothetical protein
VLSCDPSKESESEMTMRVIDVAPNEALLTVLADRLERAAERGESLSEQEIKSFLDMDPEFLETAKIHAARVFRQDRKPQAAARLRATDHLAPSLVLPLPQLHTSL